MADITIFFTMRSFDFQSINQLQYKLHSIYICILWHTNIWNIDSFLISFFCNHCLERCVKCSEFAKVLNKHAGYCGFRGTGRRSETTPSTWGGSPSASTSRDLLQRRSPFPHFLLSKKVLQFRENERVHVASAGAEGGAAGGQGLLRHQDFLLAAPRRLRHRAQRRPRGVSRRQQQQLWPKREHRFLQPIKMNQPCF